ncbi:hypothetical protein SAMD00019534_052090 [Acytostelium subglobosum LB1]|uniref:hypothetical protein n=1 Tax=Acytostelium subglobosum LB1 TaxID=1410327 RepID=UPI000644CB42|nr:hypothetical protein SAMD00019534_052090 [Acytostelium subglobosum LB1]GAM22034.1 hypothetical protein SAMD00019534_052090 [Acytostelium subglobosum LB1]|eukprot:XP_012755134.1 hypothetical protein SAMD00019534_052090 [Acytostelium subglobosum LB1]
MVTLAKDEQYNGQFFHNKDVLIIAMISSLIWMVLGVYSILLSIQLKRLLDIYIPSMDYECVLQDPPIYQRCTPTSSASSSSYTPSYNTFQTYTYPVAQKQQQYQQASEIGGSPPPPYQFSKYQLNYPSSSSSSQSLTSSK